MKPRILEIEVTSCKACPFATRCNAFLSKPLGTVFAEDCPLSFHEENYDHLAELEAENAHLKNKLKQLMEKQKWIPVESGIVPKFGEHVLTTVKAKSGVTFLFDETYMGKFADPSTSETLAWMPAPELYKPKESIFPVEYKDNIMMRFVRVE